MLCDIHRKKNTLLYCCKNARQKSSNHGQNHCANARTFPPEPLKTITCDRGTAFANRTEIKKNLNCDVYCADPYCARQKGSNENSNGLLREFYPKGRILSGFCPDSRKRNLALINARHCKILHFQSAQYPWDTELHNLLHLV